MFNFNGSYILLQLLTLYNTSSFLFQCKLHTNGCLETCAATCIRSADSCTVYIFILTYCVYYGS